jgi:hypothetical protein
MGKSILLTMRYVLGAFAIVNAFTLLERQHYLASIVGFLLVAGIFVPVNIKIFGSVNILATHFSFNQLINFIWPTNAAWRWFLGFYTAMLKLDSFSLENPFVIFHILMALIFVSPLDRFFFPPLLKIENPSLKKRRFTIFSFRNAVVGLVLFISLLNKGSIFSATLLIIAFGLLATAVLITPHFMIIHFPEPEHKNKTPTKKRSPAPQKRAAVTVEKDIQYYSDAYVIRWKMTPATTETEFNELIKDFEANLLKKNDYKPQLSNHRNPEEFKSQIINLLTLYARQILKRPEMIIQKYPDHQPYPVTVPEQIGAIWKTDKKLRSLYNATKRYASQRGARSFWEIAPHVAEFRATINVIKKISRTQIIAVSSTKQEININHKANLSLTPEEIALLSDDTYFKIIDYIVLLGKNMESYNDFHDNFNEERYREYFLPFLNAVSPNYSAKGEVFNRKGKTDILIFDLQGRNIFIAECKIWNGEAYLLKAVDQLLQTYINWRDEKTAIIIFNRDTKNFSQLIITATNALSKHPLCYETGKQRSDTSWSYWFRHPDDSNRLIRLELILFNFV